VTDKTPFVEAMENIQQDIDSAEVRMSSLCWTDTTLYGVDVKGRVWFIDMRTGKWALHSNPTEPELKK
jgi:hypothetical protein